MANLTRIAAPRFDASNPSLLKITGLVAGEAIAAGDLCYIKSDGKAWIGTGAAATAPALVVGMAALSASVSEAVTLLCAGWRWQYSTGLTPGARYFLGTAGLLADAATTGGDAAIAIAVSATDIILVGMQVAAGEAA